jgi:hypothetical protein
MAKTHTVLYIAVSASLFSQTFEAPIPTTSHQMASAAQRCNLSQYTPQDAIQDAYNRGFQDLPERTSWFHGFSEHAEPAGVGLPDVEGLSLYDFSLDYTSDISKLGMTPQIGPQASAIHGGNRSYGMGDTPNCAGPLEGGVRCPPSTAFEVMRYASSSVAGTVELSREIAPSGIVSTAFELGGRSQRILTILIGTFRQAAVELTSYFLRRYASTRTRGFDY